jgi:hypothetical protein
MVTVNLGACTGSIAMAKISIADLNMRVLPILKRNNIRSASLFGSFARGESKENSDIDMLVEYGAGTTLFKAAKLKIELENELGCRVDLVSPENLHPKIKQKIAKDQIRLL